MALFNNPLNTSFSFLKRKKEEPIMNQLTPGLSSINNSLNNASFQPKTNGGIASGPNQNYSPYKPQTTQPTPKFDTSSYLDKINQNSQNRINLQNTATQGLVGRLKTSGEAGVNALKSQIPTLEGGFNKFKEGVYSGLENVKKATAMGKQNIIDTSGANLRQGAEGWRQTQGQIDKKFANLNAVDSGAYQNRYVNAGTEFANKQQGLLGQQSQDLAKLDMELVSAQSDAEQLISQEEATLQKNIAQINASIAQGTAEYEQAIADAYNTAQSNIYDIEDTLATFQQNVAVEQAKQGGGLSNGFLTTGIPETQADYLYKLKNPDDVTKAFKDTGQSPAAKKALELVDKLSQRDFGAITGIPNPLKSLTGENQDTMSIYNQLKATLQLDNIKMLKGTGQISDKEEAILEKASTRLNQTLSNQSFQTVLDELRTELGGTNANSNLTNYASILKQSGFTDQEIAEYLGGK